MERRLDMGFQLVNWSSLSIMSDTLALDSVSNCKARCFGYFCGVDPILLPQSPQSRHALPVSTYVDVHCPRQIYHLVTPKSGERNLN